MLRRPAVDRALLLLGAVVLVSTVARFALSRGFAAPWIAPDEQLYGLLGRSLADGDGLKVLGEPVPYYSLLYPLLVGLPLLWSDVAGGVTGAQALQAFLMSATAIPIFYWARPVAGRHWALVAAGLTVLIPGLTYSGLLMSETLYYPVATLAVWALAVCLRTPTLLNQAVLLGAIGVALATRLQAVGFAAVIVVAVAFMAVAERSTVPLRRMAPTLGLLGAGALVWVGSRIAAGDMGELLGAYSPLSEATEYSAGDVLQSIAWQTGAVALITIGVPLVALGVLGWHVLLGKERDREVKALVIAAAAYLAVTVVEVGAFASRFVEHVTERQLLSVAPPVFVAFAVWLHRGLPRPQPSTSVVTLGVAATALLLPLDRVTTPAAFADAPSMIQLERLSRHLEPDLFEGLYAGVAALVLLLAVVAPRRAAPALAGIVAVALATGSLVASVEIRQRSTTERERSFAGMPVRWIDETGAEDVTLLVTGERLWPTIWEELFWNTSVRRVARLPRAESPGVVHQVVVSPSPDGSLTTRDGETPSTTFVSAPSVVSVVGDRVAVLPSSFEQIGVTLWKVSPPLRLSQHVIGLRPNGDLHGGETAEVRVYGCGPGRLELTVLGKEGRSIRISVDGVPAVEQTVAPETVWRPSIPAPPDADGSRACVYRLETDGLIGTTRVEFVRGV